MGVRHGETNGRGLVGVEIFLGHRPTCELGIRLDVITRKDKLAEIIAFDKEAEWNRNVRSVHLPGTHRLDNVGIRQSARPLDIGAWVKPSALHAEPEQILIDSARRLNGQALAL